MVVYGYARCNTNEMKKDINRQVSKLLKLGCPAGTIYKEYEPGIATQKYELEKLMSVIRPGGSFVTLEISRVTRSVKQLCQFLEQCYESIYSTPCLNEGLDNRLKYLQRQGVGR